MSVMSHGSRDRDAIRVRVKKGAGSLLPEYRKFSIDPQITLFEDLRSIIAKAFDIKGDVALSYRALDDYGQEAYLPLLSDWDLDAAFLSASDPFLSIVIDAKPVPERPWASEQTCIQPGKDVFGTIEVAGTQVADNKPSASARLPGLILNRVERTFNIFQRAFNKGEEVTGAPLAPPAPPLSDSKFREFHDAIGQISHMKELRSAIYFGGVEPGLRKVVWKHILNVYPSGMSGRERMDYMKRSTAEYEALRETWRRSLQQGVRNEELAYVTGMVRKDVLRTDRHHQFYAGSDDNQNIAALFNILTTYALNHPSVSYCQGMSDLASPLLVTMGDEAHAYICFCALMARLKPNFMIDGAQMTLKFQHLSEGLLQCDPQFHAYLKYHQAEDLLFCYRWLLLEMKREFAFDDALHMLEVLWSSLEASPPEQQLPLYELKFQPNLVGSSPPISPLMRTPRENPYTKVCALRRQSSSMSLNALSSNRSQRPKTSRQNQSLDENVMARQNQLRKQGRLKPFFSLDENCIESHNEGISSSKSIGMMSSLGQADSLALIKTRLTSIQRQTQNHLLSSSTASLSEAVNKRKRTPLTTPNGANSCSSLNKLQLEKENEDVVKGRTIKNLNEFLKLAGRGRSLKPRQRSQCSSISEGDVDAPYITAPRCEEPFSDAESDLSSVRQITSPSVSSSASPNVFDAPPSDDSSPDDDQRGVSSQGDSSPDDSADYCPVTTSMTRELRLELDHLDRQVLGVPSKTDSQVFVWENPMQLQLATTPDEQGDIQLDTSSSNNRATDANGFPGPDTNLVPNNTESASATDANGFPMPETDETCEVPNFLARSALTTSSLLHSLRTGQMLRSPAQSFAALPPPQTFGAGNPFLMFLCLTLLRQHRDLIMRNQMDYNEMAMHFDKMVRKHNVTRVLEEARQMFATYLKQQSLQASQNSKNAYKV